MEKYSLNDLRRLITLGKEMYEAEEYDKALDYLEAALHLKDDLADVHNLVGVIYHQQGRLETARRHFERALEINPRYTDAALNLAVTYNDLGEYDRARGVVDTLGRQSGGTAGLEPFARGKLANMHADLAEAYRGFGLLEDAVREYERAVSLAPNFLDLRTKLADVYRELGRLEQARRQLEDVLAQKPEYVPALVGLGFVAYTEEKWDEAREHWTKARDLAPGDKKISLYITMVERKLGK